MTAQAWAVIGCDDSGVTVEKRGTDPAALADAVASWAQQEQDKWPSLGLIYMLVTSEEADTADVDTPRPWEPREVDLTQLARYLCMLKDDPKLRLISGHAVLGAWSELTGAPDDATALDYARRLTAAADRDGTRITAHVAPF